MYDPVFQFCQFGTVPPVGRAHEVSGNPLQRVNVMSVTMRAFREVLTRIFESAVQTAVPVVVHTTVADIVFVHPVHNVHDGLRLMGRISVDFHVEDMAAPFQIVIWGLHFSLMLRCAMEIHRDMT